MKFIVDAHKEKQAVLYCYETLPQKGDLIDRGYSETEMLKPCAVVGVLLYPKPETLSLYGFANEEDVEAIVYVE